MVRRAAWMAIAIATSGCSLIVGDEDRTVAPADGSDANGGAGGDAGASDPSVMPQSAPSCAVPSACTDAAMACASQCASQDVQCLHGCEGGHGADKPCNCQTQLDSCKVDCVRRCVACTTMAACPAQPACVAAVP